MFEFCYLKKDDLEKYAKEIVSVLYDNMEKIVPTGNSCEFVYEHWLRFMREELPKGKRKTILILKKETHEVAGYLQYEIHEDVFSIKDIQIKESYRGKYNIFRNLYGFLLGRLGTEIEYVEAYVSKHNAKSLGVHGKLGLSIVGENIKGNSYHLKGTYADLLNWYYGKGQ